MQGTSRILETFLSGLLFATVLIVAAPAHARPTVDPGAINFGSQTVGITASARTVTVTNSGRGPLVVSSASWSLPQFSYSGPSMPLILGPGQSMTASVFFTPTAAQTYSDTLTFKCTRGPTLWVSLSGTGIGQTSAVTLASADVAPTITTQPVNQTVTAGQTATFSVAATGTSPLTYQWMKNGAAISGATSSTYTTPPTTSSDNGTQFNVTVNNSAGSATSNAATLTINATAGQLTVNPTSLSFGSVNIGSSSTLSVTLSNPSTSSITISNVSLSGPGFDASGVPTGLILAPGNTATLNVSFSPAATGSLSGSVTISSDASNSPSSLSLSGSGTQSAAHSVSLSWNPSSSPVIGYNVYRSSVTGGPYTKLTSSPSTLTSYSDTNVQSGGTYYYVVTSVDSSDVESVYSNEVSSVIP